MPYILSPLFLRGYLCVIVTCERGYLHMYGLHKNQIEIPCSKYLRTLIKISSDFKLIVAFFFGF